MSGEIHVHSNSSTLPAVWGEGDKFEGVRRTSHNAHGGLVGVNDGELRRRVPVWTAATRARVEVCRGSASSVEHGRRSMSEPNLPNPNRLPNNPVVGTTGGLKQNPGVLGQSNTGPAVMGQTVGWAGDPEKFRFTDGVLGS